MAYVILVPDFQHWVPFFRKLDSPLNIWGFLESALMSWSSLNHHLLLLPPTHPNCCSRHTSIGSNSTGSPYSAMHAQLPPVSGYFLTPPQPSESEPAFQGAAQGFTPTLNFRKLCLRSPLKGVLSCPPISQAWTNGFFAPIVFNILN